jgi:FtsH-binding integral membrane protein
MTKPRRKVFTFAKVVTVLAIVFVVSLGLCGVTSAISSASPSQQNIYIVIMFAGLGGSVLSGLALFVTVIAWIISAVAGSSKHNAPAPRQIVDDKDDKDQLS